MEFSDIFIESSGKKLHCIRCGKGDTPLHFLHANGLCAGAYLPFLKLFENEFRIIATDIPGHGDSDHHGSARIKHWNMFIEPIKDVVEKTIKVPAVGIGHSLGAVTTLIIAAKHPHLFSKIILIDPVIFPKRKLFLIAILKKLGLMKQVPLAKGARRRKKVFSSLIEAYERFSSGHGMFKTWPDEFIRAYSEYGLKTEINGSLKLKCDPETEAQIYESILLDIWDYPKKIKCPVLVIQGKNSDTFDRYAAKRLHKELPDCSLITIPDAGHFVAMEKANECKKNIINFIINCP